MSDAREGTCRHCGDPIRLGESGDWAHVMGSGSVLYNCQHTVPYGQRAEPAPGQVAAADAPWSCTTDHVTFPGCGTCLACRRALAAGWRFDGLRARIEALCDEAEANPAWFIGDAPSVEVRDLRAALAGDPETGQT